MNPVSDHITLSTAMQQLLTPEQAWHYRIVPKEAQAEQVTFFAQVSSFDDADLDELEILLGKRVALESCDAEIITNTLSRYYRKLAGASKTVAVSSRDAEDFLSNLIAEAKNLGSSDIHIEIYDDRARVRMRIDGMLVERYELGKNDYPALINKIKIRANLDIAEKRLPQDGRIQFSGWGKRIDIRVSVLPTLHGEKVVLRLLSNDATSIDLETLGFQKNQLPHYLQGIRQTHGIVLISGPTGSGKTTTLYATLKILNEEKRNIMTVEDPIEYTLEGINQVQLKESIGLTFASALRTFLRQDPDIIMLGEIRDGETAQMAIRAALTGHLVLSTIHTNSAWGTISRLVDMGVPPFLLASTINTTAAQRLVKLLCPDCKTEHELDRSLLPPRSHLPKDIVTEWKANGCENCHFTGYKGRKAVYEIIPVDHNLSRAIKENQWDVGPLLAERSISTLAHNAIDLLRAGATSMEEVYPFLLQHD